MKLIALETSTRNGSLALAEDGCPVAEAEVAAGLEGGRDLVSALDAAARQAGWRPADAALLAVSIGPGSFTGLRLAVMFARTFAWRTRARVVAVPTLRVIADNAPGDERDIAVISDAQRGGVYWSRYTRTADGSLSRVTEEAVAAPEDVAAQLPAGALLIGDGPERYAPMFDRWRRADASLNRPRAATVARLGWTMHLAGCHTPAELLEPLYVRRPAPEEVLERRQRRRR
jgi:tRNA threonylcarbamoyladenosine biosynthesis protein TsaB